MNKKLIPTLTNNTAVLDSREVAEMLEKRHANFIRDIDGYIADIDADSTKLNFEFSTEKPSLRFFIPGEYKDSTGRTLRMFYLTKLGCEFAANKMTGKKGNQFTAAYVEAFNAMQSALSQQMDFISMLMQQVSANPESILPLITDYAQTKANEKRLAAENAVMLPKAEKHDQLMASEGGVLMKGLAGFLVQNGVMCLEFEDGTKKKNGQNNLYQWMREHDYLCKARGERYNLPMQKWIDAGLFALKAAVADISGVKREVTTTIVTPKGQSYFLDLFIKKEAILTVI